MGERRVEGKGEERWRRTAELPSYVFEVLRKRGRAINPVAVVATVDEDGTPRTAPFGSLRAVTPKLVRLACSRHHDTYGNMCRDGRVSVAVLAPPNIAVSIRGRWWWRST
jgi:flavin reductase (DIM6/NTAB) family NADH-FMN oxidoreductase RutF